MVEPSLLAHRNLPVKMMLEGAHELLGRENLRKIIDSIPSCRCIDGSSPKETLFQPDKSSLEAFLFSGLQPGAFLKTLEDIYGTRGGRGLALRIGRSVFKNGLQQYGENIGLRSVAFRLQPAPARISGGLQILARVFTEHFGDVVQVTEQDTCWEWRSEDCPVCGEPAADGPNCYLMVGLFQEFTTWAGNGRFYRVTETMCRAAGNAACVFRIDKRPLD